MAGDCDDWCFLFLKMVFWGRRAVSGTRDAFVSQYCRFAKGICCFCFCGSQQELTRLAVKTEISAQHNSSGWDVFWDVAHVCKSGAFQSDSLCCFPQQAHVECALYDLKQVQCLLRFRDPSTDQGWRVRSDLHLAVSSLYAKLSDRWLQLHIVQTWVWSNSSCITKGMSGFPEMQNF